MKKAAIATAILSALVSGSTLAATVYDKEGTSLKIGGRAEARFNISDNNESDADGTSSFEDKTRARVNIKGKTQVNDSLYGFGKYETEFDTDDEVSNRYVFAGIGTEIGEFSYGKQDSAQVMLTDFTDTLATFGGEAADAVDGNEDKRTNNFLYSGKFDAVKLQMNYIAADEQDADSFGFAALYSADMFSVGAGYVSQEDGDDDDSQINFAGELSLDMFTLGALYTMAEVGDDDYDGIELSAKMKASKELSLLAVYNKGEYDDAGDIVDEFTLEAVYKFNGHIRTYAGYKFQQIDDIDDELQAGIRYDF